jgi:hypothetical protein
MVEMNLDWRLLKEQEKLPTRTKECWDQKHVSWSHNRTSPPRQPRQYGGTALFSTNKAAHRAVEKGYDEQNLGGWTWTRYKGKSNQTLWVITAYRPNPPQGPFTVYAQQNAFFHSINREICPRQAFLMDLLHEIKKFLETGNHIILLINGSSNMKDSDLSAGLSNLSMKEVILYKHGLQGPATHKRNSTSLPIDGIWVTQGLEILNCRYFEYDAVFPSDHQCLWLDMTFMAAFGHNMAPLHKRTPRRLHCRDPRLINNYIKLYHQYVGPLDLFRLVKDLERRAPNMPKSEIIQEYEAIDNLRCEAAAFTERHCRKMRTGQVAFSPELNFCRKKYRRGPSLYLALRITR